MAIEHINEFDTLNAGREKINKHAIDPANRAELNSIDAKSVANQAKQTSQSAEAIAINTDDRLDNIIAGEMQDAEVIDARRPFGGKAYATLGERLDGEKAEVSAQLEQIINVLDLMVINDGVTDNTSIIQHALDKSNHVKISKKGTYITKRLTIHDNTTFELADGVVLKQKDNNSDYIIVNDKWKATDGTYNTNIKIIGGQYDINGGNNPRTGAILEGLYAGIGIVLNNVRNLVVKNIKEIGNAQKYCFLFANIENGEFENINCVNQSDGLHFQAPCKNVTVNNITGTCHDNLLPFTIGDYPAIVLSEDGDFDNINIKNVYSKGETIDIIRFVGDGKNGTGAFKNITIDNVQASCPSSGVIELYNNDQATPNVYFNKTIIENIKISNIKNNSQTKRNLINIWGQVKNIELNNISLPINTIGGTCISIFNTANVDNLIFENSYVKNDNNGYTFLRVEQKTNILNATINNCKIDIKGSLISNISDVEHNINIINNQITCNRFATVTGKLKTFVNNNLINFTNPTTIANDSCLFLEGEKTIFNSSGGKRFRVDFGTTNSKMRVNSKDIIMTINIDNLFPTDGDFINFFNDLSTNRKKGLYRYINNKYIFIDGELTLYVQALDFGSISANSSVVREVDLSEFGTNLTHDYKFGVVAAAYNGTGESNNVTYCSWLKDNKVKIRVSNLSSTPISIACDWLIKIIK